MGGMVGEGWAGEARKGVQDEEAQGTDEEGMASGRDIVLEGWKDESRPHLLHSLLLRHEAVERLCSPSRP